MRIVIDTNVVVAALRSKRGAAYRLLSLLPDDRFTPVISPTLYLEYVSVLLRSENLQAGNHSPEDIKGFVRELLSYSYRQRIHFQWRPILKDADDDFILELAINSGCRFIVTFNKKDFAGAEMFGIELLSPSEFWGIIEKE